jgi:hypothetical protein
LNDFAVGSGKKIRRENYDLKIAEKLFYRQGDAQGRATAGPGQNSDLPVMRLDDTPNDGEAEAGAFGFRGCKHRFECTLLLLSSHAAAGVLERHRHLHR